MDRIDIIKQMIVKIDELIGSLESFRMTLVSEIEAKNKDDGDQA